MILSTVCFTTPAPTYGATNWLASWNDTPTKASIIKFVQETIKTVPKEDRVAVFDMDGTIVCEKPLWLEMNVAQTHMFRETETDPTFISNPLYAIAYQYGLNPSAANMTAIENNVQPILLESYKDVPQETYVADVEKFMIETQNPDYHIPLKNTFYKPMVELIQYLIANDFEVYVVSGSEEGLIWGSCKGILPFGRDHMIGSRLALSPDYEREGVLIRGNVFNPPSNLNNGKTENIYYEIGKKPIFACGNTVDDFGMLSYASTNKKYKSMSMLVNHDDAVREYKYNINDRHEAINWEASVQYKKWHVISMKNDFKNIFLTTNDH
jgi:phosphoserine phosphatase